MAAQSDSLVSIKWHGVRTHIQLTITDTTGTIIGQETMTGHDLDLPWDITAEKFDLDFSKYQFEEGSLKVTLRKMTQAYPYAPGISTRFLDASVFKFYGVDATNAEIIAAPESAEHRI